MKYPELNNISSATTFKYINEAKSQTKIYSEVVHYLLIFIFVIPITLVLPKFGIEHFNNIIWWVSLVVIASIAVFISSKLAELKIRKKLSEIIESA
jgi:ABC-type uncharacterized transport system permease subunit